MYELQDGTRDEDGTRDGGLFQKSFRQRSWSTTGIKWNKLPSPVPRLLAGDFMYCEGIRLKSVYYEHPLTARLAVQSD